MRTITHTREPEHGTVIEYVNWHCRCKLCVENWELERGTFFGEPDRLTVPATIVRDYVVELLRRGMTRASIADAARVSRVSISNILAGKNERMQTRTADAILAVTANDLSPGHKVPVAFVRDLVDEMRASGLSLQWIWTHAGLSPKWHGYYSAKRVQWKSYVAVRDLYMRLATTGMLDRGGE